MVAEEVESNHTTLQVVSSCKNSINCFSGGAGQYSEAIWNVGQELRVMSEMTKLCGVLSVGLGVKWKLNEKAVAQTKI